MPTLTGVPHICITLEPGNDKRPDVSGGIWPRQRDSLEAFNGALNYGLVKSWLEKCKDQHGPGCNRQLKGHDLVLDINLIDVSTRQLVRRSTRDRYIALSYVWGKGTELRLKTSDISQTQVAADSNLSGPPRSIKGTCVPARVRRLLEIIGLC
jgi:hypothetical protein